MQPIGVNVTEQLVAVAKAEGWSGGELLATAIQLSSPPDVEDVAVDVAPNPAAVDPALRAGYVARPVPHWRGPNRAALGCGEATP